MQYQVVTLSAVSLESAKKAFPILEKKSDELTDMSDFGEFPSLFLECSSVVAAIQFVCYLYQENKATSNINELRYEMFTKKNVSGTSCAERTIKHLSGSESTCMPVLNLPPPIGNGWQMDLPKNGSFMKSSY